MLRERERMIILYSARLCLNYLLCWHVPFKGQTVMVIVVVGNNANRDHGSVQSGARLHAEKRI